MSNNIVVHYARIMNVKRNYLIYIIVVTVLFSSQVAMGQDPPEPGPAPPPPPGLPIDFGISALIAAGLGLGIHHIRNRK